MTKFAILLGGDMTPTARLHLQLQGARVIAADSGMAHAAALDLEPELWVGDFDSAGTALAAAYQHVPRVVFPAAKDATDGELAIDAALGRGATEIVLVGSLGGQFDHVLAHATLLLSLREKGIAACGTSGLEEVHPLLRRLSLPDLPRGARLSIVGLSPLQGLSISGVRWPLDQRDVRLGSSLTLSNEVAGKVSVSLEAGSALVIVYPATEGDDG